MRRTALSAPSYWLFASLFPLGVTECEKVIPRNVGVWTNQDLPTGSNLVEEDMSAQSKGPIVLLLDLGPKKA